MAPGAEPVLQWSLAGARHDGARGGAHAPMAAHRFFLDSSNSAPKRVFRAKGFLEARTEMAAATAGSAPAKEVVEKKVEFMKEIRAHEVAIAELGNLNPSRAVYQKAGNIFFRKSVKSVVTTEQNQLDQAKARLNKLNQV